DHKDTKRRLAFTERNEVFVSDRFRIPCNVNWLPHCNGSGRVVTWHKSPSRLRHCDRLINHDNCHSALYGTGWRLPFVVNHDINSDGQPFVKAGAILNGNSEIRSDLRFSY